MPELSTLMLFAVASLALTATPGPDMMLVAARSAAQGRSAGFATYLGVATGSFVHAIASAIGLSQLEHRWARHQRHGRSCCQPSSIVCLGESKV